MISSNSVRIERAIKRKGLGKRGRNTRKSDSPSGRFVPEAAAQAVKESCSNHDVTQTGEKAWEYEYTK